MRCLMCGRNKDGGTFRDIFDGADPLCQNCRRQWQKKKIRFRLDGIPAESSYVYNDAFSSCLIQFKEQGDEALKDVFLHEVCDYLHFRYHGYTLCLMPSTDEKYRERGFHHLRSMFECLKMPVTEPFVKISGQSQKKLGRRERLEMRSMIALAEGAVLPEKVLLCDDTVTTGATLSGALSVLPESVRKVRIYTVSANVRWL